MKKQVLVFINILKYSLFCGKLLTGFLIVSNILLGLSSTLQVWIVGRIIDFVWASGKVDVSPIDKFYICIPYFFVGFILLLVQKILFAIIPFQKRRLSIKVKSKMTQELFEAVNKISPVCQELNEEQMAFGRAMDFINNNLEISLHSILVLVSGFTSMVSVLVLLSRYSIIFPFVVIITSLPVIFIRLKQDKAMHEMYRKQYSANQLGNYYMNMLITKDSLVEIRLFGADSLFLDKYQYIVQGNIKQRTRYFVHHMLYGNMLESMLILLGNLLLVCYALYLMIDQPGIYPISMITIVISGVMSAQEAIINFAFNGKYIAIATMYGEDFWNLIQKKEGIWNPKRITGTIRKIELKNVNFYYPNRQDNQLTDINMTLSAGDIIGIVGENGSGKSTLAKLLLGLYIPSEGEIWVNDIKIPSSGVAYENVSSIFQDYVCYELTVKENICLGKPEDIFNREKIYQAAEIADADDFIQQLPLQYNTAIGSLLKDSVQLSSGQWRKLAMARGLYIQGSFFILDEPSANLDVIAEITLFRRYCEQIHKRNSIGVLISHQLGFTHYCDKVFVMQDGKIVQSGSFEELVKQEGLFKSMYKAQSQWYHKS